VQNSNYLIDPDYLYATNILKANPQGVPKANGDNERLCPNTWVSIDLTNFAVDPLNLPLTATLLTYPSHGILTNISLPNVTYVPNHCYEGQDSFTFKVSDGQYDSAPATVTLNISSGLYATPTLAQTCRGAPVSFGFYCGISCGGNPSYVVTSTNLAHGTLDTNSLPNYVTYTPTNANFTGTDTFNYLAYDDCGYAITGAVSIYVGDTGVNPNSQTALAGTNRPVNITLSASDNNNNDSCIDDASNYTYTVVGGPSDGALTNSGTNLIYTPNTGFEGLDSFQFTAGDGVWTSPIPATVKVYVVAGQTLTAGCNPFKTGPSVELDWFLDDAVQQMQTEGLNIRDYKIYSSTNSGGPYACIGTNTDVTQMSYTDTNAVAGHTNYYVVTFEFRDSSTGITYESPRSNEIIATGQNPDDLIAPDAIWEVTDVTTNRPPQRLGNLQAPFSSAYPNQYPGLYLLPNTYWPPLTTWSNHISMYIPSNVVLTNVLYAIAIDNSYQLYANTNYIGTGNNNNTYATWSSFQSFPANLLHHGTNDIGVVIQDIGSPDYFSMVVTTNTCGQ
jgi:hypothetical protein